MAKNREFPLLKALGKRIVSIFLGSDVRHTPSMCDCYAELELSDECFEELAHVLGDSNTTRQLHHIRMAEAYSDLVISRASSAVLGIRPFVNSNLPINLSNYNFRIPSRDRPVIVHAPSSRQIKGTQQIIDVLDRLRNEKLEFDFRVLSGVTNDEVIRQVSSADVAIDQLYLPGYGKFSLEALASGCALATSSNEDCEPYPPNRPILSVRPSNLYEQLKRLLTNKNLRRQLASDGREFVECHHCHIAVARRILDLLNQTRIEKYEHYPTYFARQFKLDEDERLPKHLLKMTTRIVRRWGLPSGVNPNSLVQRRLMAPLAERELDTIPRWET